MIPLRPPSAVMTLERLGASHQTRLSFMRVLLRLLRRGGWQADRPVWEVDAKGVGHAVYRMRGQGQTYSLVAYAHDLPDDQRSDRVIAEAWDATFALVDGEASAADIERLRANVPLQEAGRVSDRELVLSRANRSVRLWSHVVERLAAGAQPDPALLAEVGYLMRTTAVYGSGKFGAADFAALRGRPVLDGPFRAEMLAVWLIRAFTVDLAEHMARVRGGAGSATLAPGLRRTLGIGNSTGLGMAPFLINHPQLLNAWITARETALARVRGVTTLCEEDVAAFRTAVARTVPLLDSWRTEHPYQIEKIDGLRHDIGKIAAVDLSGPSPWDRLWRWGEVELSAEGQELLVSLMLEPFGSLIDDLAETMTVDETMGFAIDGRAPVSELLAGQDWALAIDHGAPTERSRFWYVSEAKLEPRLGERFEEPGADKEQPLDTARAIAALAKDLPGSGTVAQFLRAYPQHRHTVRRLQQGKGAPYAMIRDNLIGAGMMPVDLLRCKLAFFGATRFDPRSDRWLRITMFQGAPFPDELLGAADDDWVLPLLARAAE